MSPRSIFDLIEYQKKYARKNRLKQKAKARKHYLKNRGAFLLRARKQREADPAKVKEYDRLRYQRLKNRVKARMRAYYNKNKNAVKARVKKYKDENPKKALESYRSSYKKNKIKHLFNNRKYYYRNRRYLLMRAREWRKANSDKIRNSRKAYFAKHPEALVVRNLMVRLYKMLGKNAPNNLTVLELVGCTLPSLRRHIEKQFKSGMSWQNRGKVWHLDHIIPISLFEPEDMAQANHFSNLRPMYAHQNLSRGCKVRGHFVIRGGRLVEHST